MQKHLKIEDLPGICKRCKNVSYDFQDEYSPNVYYCMKNLILPTKKKSCKKAA